MTAALDVIYSAPFAVGLVAGIVGQRLYCYGVLRYVDAHHPRPNGRRRHVAGISKVWWAGLLVFAVIGYVLLQTARTEERYQSLATDVATCQREFNEALRARSDLTTENDRISVESREILRQLDEAAGDMVRVTLNPPPLIAAMPLTDPRRSAWESGVMRSYYERTSVLRAALDANHVEQVHLHQERAKHPLPEPSCGGVLPR